MFGGAHKNVIIRNDFARAIPAVLADQAQLD